MTVTDFGNSYMTWEAPHDATDTRKPGHMPWGNSARILIDARCTITDQRTGKREELYLIAPCRTEWMYLEEGLFQDPSGEYRVIFAQDRQLAVGKSVVENGSRPGSISTARFTKLAFTINQYASATPLERDADVVAATQQNLPIVARTEIESGETGLRASLEYPIRTMNFHPERTRFQVDTGPIIFPDLEASDEHWIDRCRLAHVAYNTFSGADFVCKQPTPITVEGRAIAEVFHYSDFRRVDAKHTLFCAGDLAV